MTDGGTATTLLFVIGTGRCGSTLLHEVLARHPDVGFLSNVDDLLRTSLASNANSWLYRRVPPQFTTKGRLRFAPSEGYRALTVQVSPMVVDPVRDLVAEDATPWMQERMRRFFLSTAERQNRPVFMHKFTGWPRARFIHAVFPAARFVNVVRDGRAVANSFLQMPWWTGYRGPARWSYGPLPSAYAQEWQMSGQSFPVLAGICWKLLMDEYEATRQAIPSNLWVDVRYEDLLAEPRETMSGLLDFLGLEWTTEFDLGFRRHSFSGRRAGAFHMDLDPNSLRLLEASLTDHLRRSGYAVPSPQPRSVTDA